MYLWKSIMVGGKGKCKSLKLCDYIKPLYFRLIQFIPLKKQNFLLYVTAKVSIEKVMSK